MSVHILGIGAMGMLLAHEYAAVSTLKPTLLVKHKNVFKPIQHLEYSMTLARHTDQGVHHTTARMETHRNPRAERWDPRNKITNLVVAVKTHSVKDALDPYIQFITPETNVVFIQNGMGVLPMIRDQIWQPNQEPNMYHILSSHGAYKERINLTRHVGIGSLNIARVPLRKSKLHQSNKTISESKSEALNKDLNETLRQPLTSLLTESTGEPSNELASDISESFEGAAGAISQTEIEELPEIIQALLRSPHLNAKFTSSFPEFEVAQMEKLVVNACINPLTAMMDCKNGELLRSNQTVSMMKKIVDECSQCFRQNSEVLAAVPEASAILSPERLFRQVVLVCQNTAQNSSSMREDISSGKMTEIDSINGYVVKLGLQSGIPTPVNTTLYNMISARHKIDKFKEREYLGDS